MGSICAADYTGPAHTFGKKAKRKKRRSSPCLYFGLPPQRESETLLLKHSLVLPRPPGSGASKICAEPCKTLLRGHVMMPEKRRPPWGVCCLGEIRRKCSNSNPPLPRAPRKQALPSLEELGNSSPGSSGSRFHFSLRHRFTVRQGRLRPRAPSFPFLLAKPRFFTDLQTAPGVCRVRTNWKVKIKLHCAGVVFADSEPVALAWACGG